MMLWMFLIIVKFGVCFGQLNTKLGRGPKLDMHFEKHEKDRLFKLSNSGKLHQANDSWYVEYTKKENKYTFFLKMKSLNFTFQSWKCNVSRDLQWSYFHGYVKANNSSSVILLGNMTCEPGQVFESAYCKVWCEKTNVTSGRKYIAVKEELSHSGAQAYCSNGLRKFNANGTLCSFDSEWNKIRDLIRTIEFNRSGSHYWTGLKFKNESNSYVFSDGTIVPVATNVPVATDSQGLCVVATSSRLERWPCSNKTYFICEITMDDVNSEDSSHAYSYTILQAGPIYTRDRSSIWTILGEKKFFGGVMYSGESVSGDALWKSENFVRPRWESTFGLLVQYCSANIVHKIGSSV